MAYISRADISIRIPAGYLTQGLDDDGDGVEDSGSIAALISAADNAVDALIAGAVALPLESPYPAVVTEASAVFACEMLYERRGVSDNPFKDRAEDLREQLRMIGTGKLSLTSTTQSKPRITEPSRDFEKADQDGI